MSFSSFSSNFLFPQSQYHFFIPESSSSFLSQRGASNGDSDQSIRICFYFAFLLTFSPSCMWVLPTGYSSSGSVHIFWCGWFMVLLIKPILMQDPTSRTLPLASNKYNLNINFTNTAYSKITFSWACSLKLIPPTKGYIWSSIKLVFCYLQR